jgi:hypothetical protein
LEFTVFWSSFQIGVHRFIIYYRSILLEIAELPLLRWQLTEHVEADDSEGEAEDDETEGDAEQRREDARLFHNLL